MTCEVVCGLKSLFSYLSIIYIYFSLVLSSTSGHEWSVGKATSFCTISISYSTPPSFIPHQLHLRLQYLPAITFSFPPDHDQNPDLNLQQTSPKTYKYFPSIHPSISDPQEPSFHQKRPPQKTQTPNPCLEAFVFGILIPTL